MLDSLYNIRLEHFRVIIVVLIAISLCACAGVHEKQLTRKYDKNDESGLFHDITGKEYTKIENYKSNTLGKNDVVSAWGVPVSIYRNDDIETWVYEREMSFGALWILIPLPIAVWPTGYYKTNVSFMDERVISVSSEYGEFETYPKVRLH